ncbi:aspartate aminotransferase family protein [Parvibaculum sp.]|uniref:pyridoxal phosphate-dependent decarboxylase family protein n=1 Tax=Parvibaculum sp. TaxID=2024848 RepID=UPI0027307F59|nr:aspartate aminotransferase family protein [Parvibaculum sp.]MDP1626873.1 aspartate aminotransferase family protein [Parvibaculum sp.]MDP2148519.1 aspartate aminotransferase family protein [Parvibaculum sp.]MDP3329312.1 aspartate aminotransferase family protein [Parvibaculum sp.]
MGTTLPKQGTDWNKLKAEMEARGSHDVKWREGKTAVYVFNAGPEVAQVQKEAYAMFMSENGLGPMAFPSLKQMEDEVVAMGLGLLHGPEGAAGNITSGGTDSITMAIKTARDFARKEKGVTGPCNIVAPWSAHPAFDKAAKMMEIEMRRVPCADLLADVDAMEKAVDANTIMLVGSAPCFPYGLIDPIEALGQLAEKKNVWLHVDACVGGYIAPFVRMNGGDIPPFDFEVPAVSSMSADLHKYGYCAKGASTVLFRSEELRAHMIFDCADWPGGRMVTPTLAGTRPGGAIAAAWAVMNFLGEEGYRAKHRQVTDARETIEAGAVKLGFRVLGRPQLGIVAFTHDEEDPFAVWGKLFERGWFTSLTTEPKGLHLMLSPFHAQVTDTYLTDLEWALGEVKAGNEGKKREARYS